MILRPADLQKLALLIADDPANVGKELAAVFRRDQRLLIKGLEDEMVSQFRVGVLHGASPIPRIGWAIWACRRRR